MATPKLRFKEFSSLWKKNKFSECFDFHMTNSYSRAKLSGQGDVMNIHYGDIHTKFSTLFDVAKESVPFITSKTDCLKIKKDQFLRIGDLVIADASEDYEDIGKTLEVINLNGKQVVAGLHTYIARPNETYATGFFGYLMQTEKVRKQIKVLATGISVLGISKTNLNKLDLDLPPLKEQTKIATFLSAVDTKIDELIQKHELLSEYKKGMMQQLFSQKLRFKADDGSDFEDWEDRTLGEVVNFFNGKRVPLSSSERQKRQGDYRYFGASGVIDHVDDYIFDGEYILIGEDGANILTRSSPLAFLVTGKFWLNNHAHIFRSKNGNNFFLASYLETLNYEQYNSGTAQPKLNLKNLKDIPVINPILEEQTKIASFLTAIDQKIDNVTEQIDHAKTWKKGLLQQMFV